MLLEIFWLSPIQMNVNLESLTNHPLEGYLIQLHCLLLHDWVELRQMKLGEAAPSHLEGILHCSPQQLAFPWDCCHQQSQSEPHAELHLFHVWCQPWNDTNEIAFYNTIFFGENVGPISKRAFVNTNAMHEYCNFGILQQWEQQFILHTANFWLSSIHKLKCRITNESSPRSRVASFVSALEWMLQIMCFSKAF